MLKFVFLILALSGLSESFGQTLETVCYENILKLYSNIDSLEMEFGKIAPCDQLILINQQFVAEYNPNDYYLYDGCRFPLSIMLSVLAAQTQIYSAARTALGLAWWEIKDIQKDYLAWKDHYGCDSLKADK